MKLFSSLLILLVLSLSAHLGRASSPQSSELNERTPAIPKDGTLSDKDGYYVVDMVSQVESPIREEYYEKMKLLIGDGQCGRTTVVASVFIGCTFVIGVFLYIIINGLINLAKDSD